jgi:phosphopantothenate synthetase
MTFLFILAVFSTFNIARGTAKLIELYEETEAKNELRFTELINGIYAEPEEKSKINESYKQIENKLQKLSEEKEEESEH